ncbi:MAG TPA: peptidylprolyl isomerase [Verrucomicrobiae bacterium]|jgi:parvulin-like peptidyl-prolyl isomerase
MKLKLILSAALLSGVICAQAATENAAATAAAADTTNAADAMKQLFGDPDVVKATTFTIKRSELDQIVGGAKANAASQGQQVPAGFDASVLNQMISIQLLLQKATDADRVAGKAESDAQYKKLLERFGSEAAFQRQLTAVGMTVDALRAKATQEATAKAALKREVNAVVTDAEVQAYYTNHAADFEVPETVHVRHILLMTMDPTTRAPLATNEIADKRKQIDDLLKRARAGEDFATLAKQYSEDPGSKDNGGEYTFPRGQMEAEFEAAAFSLTNNQISDVVKTVYGFHIIKLLDRQPAHKLLLSDKVPGSDLTIAADIKEALLAQKVSKVAPDFINKLRAEYKVEILDPDLKAKYEALQAQAAAAANAPDAAPGLPQ